MSYDLEYVKNVLKSNDKIYKFEDLQFIKKSDKTEFIPIADNVANLGSGEVVFSPNNTKRYINSLTCDFNFKDSGLVVAGGLMTAKEYYQIKDVDIFIIADNENQAKKQINVFLDHIRPLCEKIVVTKNCITILPYKFSMVPIQIICRYYKKAADIISDFDISAACVYYDGEEFYFNEESKFTYETGYIILNANRINSSFANRLNKYINKGFGLVLPYMDNNVLNSLLISDCDNDCKNINIFFESLVINVTPKHKSTCKYHGYNYKQINTIQSISNKMLLKNIDIPEEYTILKQKQEQYEQNEYYGELNYKSNSCIEKNNTKMLTGEVKLNMLSICGVFKFDEFMTIFNQENIFIEIRSQSLYTYQSFKKCFKKFTHDEMKIITEKFLQMKYKVITIEEFFAFYTEFCHKKYDKKLLKISFPLIIQEFTSDFNRAVKVKFQTTNEKFYGKYYIK